MLKWAWNRMGLDSNTVVPESLGATRCGPATLWWGRRTYVMGIVNLSPDSFSGDGLAGRWEEALARAQRLEAEGADIIDVGGESTRPGATPISAQEELERVLPFLERLMGRVQVPISIDTYKSEVAEAALKMGASMVNDVWGLKKDRRLASLAARYGVPLVLTHNQEGTAYRDLVEEVMGDLRRSLEVALEDGVPRENIILDPGLGFGKRGGQNLAILRRLEEFRALGRPILVGTSRKFSAAKALGIPDGDRLGETAATVALAIAHGADMVRVHDVGIMVRVARMADMIVRQGW
ncbi:MAG: dihydropteroate synthase [Dehalococcoidia bacterium]|nr:dihydropteroate synthase [Dehalococcoidia bacterium]